MSGQNAQEKSTQPASKTARGRQKIHPAVEITPWQSWQKVLPTEKLIQALRRSKNGEEEPNHLAQVRKATLLKKKCEQRLCATLTFIGMSCFSSTFQVSQRSGHASLFHIDANQELYRQQHNYAHQTSSWFQNETYAELQQPGVWQQNKSRENPR